MRGVIAPLLTLVPAILHVCDDSKICLSIVQAVVIYMVYEFIARDIEYLPMHSYFFSPAVVCLDHPYCIEAPFVAHSKPFMAGELIVILRVDYRKFSLRKGYPAEGVAVVYFSVPKQYPYAQPKDKLR